MIIQIDSFELAVGMHWRPLLVAGSAQKQASAEKRSYLWQRSAEPFYGLLAGEDAEYRPRKGLYSAAIVFRRAFARESNVLGIFRLDDRHYMMCGILQGRPRDRFDAVVEGDDAVGILLKEFGQQCDGGPFRLVGDIQLPQMEAASLDSLARQLGAEARLSKVRRSHARQFALALATAGVLGAGFAGWQYREVARQEELRRTAQAAELAARQQYNEASLVLRTAPAWRARDIAAFTDWVGGLSRQIGGWYLAEADCSFAAGALDCQLSYRRSSYSLATYRSFLDDLVGVSPADVSFNDDGARILLKARTAVPKAATAAAIDAAPAPRTATIAFGSLLQQVGGELRRPSGQLFAFAPAPLPPAPAGAGAAPLLVSPLILKMPMRAAPLVTDFPDYVVIDKAKLTAAAEVSAGGESAFNIELAMRVFAQAK